MVTRKKPPVLARFENEAWDSLLFFWEEDPQDREQSAILARVKRAALWWARRWPVPKPESRADRVAALLLERSSSDFTEALAKVVIDLAHTSEVRVFERHIGQRRWRAIYRRLIKNPALASYVASRHQDIAFLHFVESVIFSDGADPGGTMVEMTAVRFPFLVSPGEAESYPATIAAVAECLESCELVPRARSKWEQWVAKLLDERHTLDSHLRRIAAYFLTPAMIRRVLNTEPRLALIRWRDDQLLERAVGIDAEAVFSAFRGSRTPGTQWEFLAAGQDFALWTLLWDLVKLTPQRALELLPVEIGFEAAKHEPQLLTIDGEAALSRFLARSEIALPSSPPEAAVRQAALWCLLHRLARFSSWDHSSEHRGTQVLLRQFVDEHPDEWARALPWLLPRLELVGEIEPLTVKLAASNAAVRQTLATLVDTGSSSVVRDRARGIIALANGFTRPSAEVAADWLSFAARQLDGTPVFPHPLRTTSSTWISDPELEHLLRGGIERAAAEFGVLFRAQGGIHEDALTSDLLRNMERAFRATDLRISAVDPAPQHRPALRVERRQIGPAEENKIGCDVAMIVDVHVAAVLELGWAEFIQVKKPERGTGANFIDRWRIDLAQLDDLLATSATACYWLFGAAGEVFVIPARFLAGTRRARSTSAASMTVSYAEIRSMAIPLSQFVVDLLSGGWIGGLDEPVLKKARGEDLGWAPLEIFRIDISVDRERARG